jgi:hypothetical protein
MVMATWAEAVAGRMKTAAAKQPARVNMLRQE